MKKFILVATLILSACSTLDVIKEPEYDNKDCINIRKFKVLQALSHNNVLTLIVVMLIKII